LIEGVNINYFMV